MNSDDRAVILATARAMRQKAMKTYLYKWDATKTQGAYLMHLWADMRDYYNGDTDGFGFIDAFTGEIDNQFRRAWNEGAKEAGVDPRDMGDADIAQVDARIMAEYEHILGLADAIDAARAEGMTAQEFRASFYSRAQMWANRYAEVKTDAIMWFGRGKLVWRLGATEEHCETCSRLNGIVAYIQEWDESGYRPQNAPNDKLECGGWRCDCSLEPTTDRVTRGGIPR